MIIDSHAHIFPEKIAEKASKNIGSFYDMDMGFDGSIDTLLKIGGRAGIDRFLVHSVATTPEQVPGINRFLSEAVAASDGKFIGFATLHPDMGRDDMEAAFAQIKPQGLSGIKLHPDFQRFELDSEAAYKIYELAEHNFPVLIHTGDSRYNFSNPHRVVSVCKDFKNLKLICAHFGGWSQWNEAEETLKGLDIYVDTSSSLYALPNDRARSLINMFGVDKVLFGSDYPMWNPVDEIENIHALKLGAEAEDRIFYKNISDLLGI